MTVSGLCLLLMEREQSQMSQGGKKLLSLQNVINLTSQRLVNENDKELVCVYVTVIIPEVFRFFQDLKTCRGPLMGMNLASRLPSH